MRTTNLTVVLSVWTALCRATLLCAQESPKTVPAPAPVARTGKLSPHDALLTYKEIEQRWGKVPMAEVTTAAQAGDALAQCEVGARFGTGNGVKTNLVEAFQWYYKAAEQGLAHAQFRVGLMYEQGHGVPHDRSLAMKWMYQSADQGYTLGELNLGWLYANDEAKPGETITGNYPVAAEWYTKAAQKGHAHAQFLLAELYRYRKLGDDARSNCVPWYVKSAGQGHVKAQAALSDLGNSFPNHELLQFNRLLPLVLNSAKKGDLEAQFQLAMRYKDGQGVATNYAEAFHWMKMAAANEAESSRVFYAHYELGRMYELGQGTAKSLSQALSHYQVAAEGGYPDALYRLGQIYEEGAGVSKDLQQAVDFYFRAASAGWGPSFRPATQRMLALYVAGQGVSKEDVAERLGKFQNNLTLEIQLPLGEIYFQGKVVPRDYTAAARHFTSAAKLGSAQAELRLGQMWAAGISGQPEPTEAAAWFQRAALQGLAEAQFQLGLCYSKPTGLPRDLVAAWQWLSLAERQNFPLARLEREKIETRITPAQIEEARAKADQFQPAPASRP